MGLVWVACWIVLAALARGREGVGASCCESAFAPALAALPAAPLSTGGSLPPALLVLLGAVPGAWIRWAVVSSGGRWLRRRHWATWMVNMLACLLLGLLVVLQTRWDQATRDTLQLALAIGFLGSLSTFSTLIAELVTSWRLQDRPQALRLGLASLSGGLLACWLGQALAQLWR